MGCIVALFALAFYGQLDVALVIIVAMVLSLLVAALAGILVPVGLQRFGRNPVLGSSVLLTAVTDGFFLLLGFAAVWLR